MIIKTPWQEKAYNIHNNFYDYSKFIYKNMKSKSIIICPDHGEFLQTMNQHLHMRQGCPKCGLSQVDNRNTVGTIGI